MVLSEIQMTIILISFILENGQYVLPQRKIDSFCTLVNVRHSREGGYPKSNRRKGGCMDLVLTRGDSDITS